MLWVGPMQCPVPRRYATMRAGVSYSVISHASEGKVDSGKGDDETATDTTSGWVTIIITDQTK